ncbi:hypothetical protein ACIF6L_34545 [Kitasatospora sp. NPDC086009]|uniref:hypothetical protein n=1 Tax=unclassified Kitasatospora TaxID=2633591 RepID=UPI0037C96509
MTNAELVRLPCPPVSSDRLTPTDVRMLATFVSRRAPELQASPAGDIGTYQLGTAAARLRKELLAALSLRDRATDDATAAACAREIVRLWGTLARMAGPWRDRPDWDALWSHPISAPDDLRPKG